jgi:hypothetical protein
MIVVHPNPKNDAIYQSFLRFQCKCTMFIVATVIFTSCQLVLFFAYLNCYAVILQPLASIIVIVGL